MRFKAVSRQPAPETNVFEFRQTLEAGIKGAISFFVAATIRFISYGTFAFHGIIRVQNNNFGAVSC